MKQWHKLIEDTPVFKQGALYEPGYTEVAYFKIVNEGSLALEYQMHTDVISENTGLNVDGEILKLSDYIKAYTLMSDNTTFAPISNRETAATAAVAGLSLNEAVEVAFNEANTMNNTAALLPNEEAYCTMVLHMPTTVGNEANYGELKPSLNLGICVLATQYDYEEDSFDKDYDKDATYPEIEYPVVEQPAQNIDLSVEYPDESSTPTIDYEVNGTITIPLTYPTVFFDGASGNTKVVLKELNTLVFENCDFTLNDGEVLVDNQSDRYDCQVIFSNVTINGTKVTSDNMNDYVKNVGSPMVYK